MDKIRDMRRAGSRFSRQSGGHKLLSEKSKKEKVRKLSAVNGRGSPTLSKEDGEMGCSDLSDRENECPSQSPPQPIINNDSSKRFKIPRKSFDDCNVVDHASVPRKLRSAMKKRNRDSISPPLPEPKRLNQTLGGESSKKDGVNSHKLNLKQRDSQWSREKSTSGPITKDEEEVVETLYALAGMFSDNDPSDKSKAEGESLEGKHLPSPETVDNPAIEGKKEASSVCPREAVKPTSSANLEISPNEAVKTNTMVKTCTEQLPHLPDSKRFRREPDNSTPQGLSSFGKTESNGKRPSSISGNFHGLPDLTLEFGFKPSKPEINAPSERQPETAFGATSINVHLKQAHATKETPKNGSALWPGLSSTLPLGTRSDGPSQPSTSKLPAWLDAALCSSKPSSSQNGTSAKKVSAVTTNRKSMKRCAAHVYISRLIQNLQNPESKENMPLQFIEPKHQEEVKQAASMPRYDFNKVTNGINGTSLNPYETGSRSHLQHRKLHQDPAEVAQASTSRTFHKQSYDFLSASAGDGETNNSSNKVGNTFGTLPRHHQAPYLHSFPQQHQPLMPFSLPQARSTSAYSDQPPLPEPSAQQGQMLLPPYLNNPFYGYTSPPGMSKQQQHHLQQHQRLWAAQLAANCRATGTSSAVTQFPGWKSGKNESPAVLPPPSSLDALGPLKYASAPHHQQSLMPISLSLPPKAKGHHLPFGYEETGAGFRSGGPIPMQLLCNERL